MTERNDSALIITCVNALQNKTIEQSYRLIEAYQELKNYKGVRTAIITLTEVHAQDVDVLFWSAKCIQSVAELQNTQSQKNRYSALAQKYCEQALDIDMDHEPSAILLDEINLAVAQTAAPTIAP